MKPSILHTATLGNQQYIAIQEDITIFFFEKNNASIFYFNTKLKQFELCLQYSVTQPFSFYDESVLDIFFDFIHLQSQTDNKWVILNQPLFELVPNAFVNFENSNNIISNSLQNIDAQIQFNTDKYVIQTLNKYLGNYRIIHAATGLLTHLLWITEKLEQDFVSINVSKEKIDIIVFKGGSLQLINSYLYHTTEDIIYFLQFAFSEFEFSNAATRVYLSGELTSSSVIYSAISKYFLNIEFIVNHAEIQQPFQKIPHQYFSILALPYLPCE